MSFDPDYEPYSSIHCDECSDEMFDEDEYIIREKTHQRLCGNCYTYVECFNGTFTCADCGRVYTENESGFSNLYYGAKICDNCVSHKRVDSYQYTDNKPDEMTEWKKNVEYKMCKDKEEEARK